MCINLHIIQRNVENKQQIMKGKLIKTDEGWMVEHGEIKPLWPPFSQIVKTEYTLHPDDVKQINRDAQVFDNIEARIAAYPDVEFEIVEQYAKLK